MGMNATPAAIKFVSYCRVSTDEQGRSGLGMEAQAAAIRAAVAAQNGTIIREFADVASGNDDARPGLEAALKLCRRTGAKLVVSKLDRLSRAVATIARIMRDRGIDLIVAECVGASPLELHIRAAFAQEERQRIACRTKDALGALKARGVKLGSSRPGHWKGREHLRAAGQIKAVAVAAGKRREARADVYAAAAQIAQQHAGTSLRKLAASLNSEGLQTPRGCVWTAAAVARMLAAVAV